jgi:aminomethyltransferase
VAVPLALLALPYSAGDSSPVTDHDTEEHVEDLPLDALPLDAWHRARGARMVPFAGYEMPIQYEGIVAEHNWTRENAGL